MVLGNKIDLERQVRTKEGIDKTDEFDCLFNEVSAKVV